MGALSSDVSEFMSKCATCQHLNRDKSNEMWIVCDRIPLDVMLAGTSKDCSKYEALVQNEAVL